MRITAGQWRGRVIHSPEDGRIRPTSDKVRQAAFNTLFSHAGSCDGAAVLDLCCGSGIMALEALSRGAAMAMAIDSHPESLALAQKNASILNTTLAVLRTDVRTLPLRPPQQAPFDLVFADPPYNHGLTPIILDRLTAGEWLAPDAWIILETEVALDLKLPDGFHLITQKTYGGTCLWFLHYDGL